MKIFQTIQKKYAIVGIRSSNQSTQKCPFDKKSLLIFMMIVSLISQFMFILVVASSFMEYSECISVLSGAILISIGSITMIFKTTALFECIDKMEKLIDTSKLSNLGFHEFMTRAM